MFGKKNNNSEPVSMDAAAIAKLKRQLRTQILTLTLCVAVAGAAAFAFATRAWFAMNREVSSSDNTISSDTASPSLYIRKTGDLTTAYASAVTTPASGSLFPSSTGDLTNWYFASGFTYTPQTVTGSGYTYTVNTPIANAYTKITSFISADAGTYTNTYESKTRTAYYLSKVNLYTTDGNLDVYLNSVNPITVAYDPLAVSDSKVLLNALRVGISVGGTMKFIYAPVAESGTGNSSGASADTLYYINSSGVLTAAGANVVTSLTGFTAQTRAGSDYLYEPVTAATPICTATTSGTDVYLYVWLEGTDAQALYGLADNDLKGIDVTVNYVGVEPTAP